MNTLGFILWLILQGYFLIMFARAIIEFITFNKGTLRANSVIQIVSKFTFMVTEPLLKVVRKVIPIFRLGSMGIDLSWAILMLIISIASSAVQYL